MGPLSGLVATPARPRVLLLSVAAAVCAACATAAALVPARKQHAVTLRLPAAARTERSLGYVHFTSPAAWTNRRASANGPVEALFDVKLAGGCEAGAITSAQVTISRSSAARQLRTELPAASQPGVPRPGPVRTLAAGSTANGNGAWRLISPTNPDTLALYGAALISRGHNHWAGLAVQISVKSTCRMQLLQRSGQPRAIKTLLRTITVQRTALG